MSEICVQFVWAIGKGQKKGKFYSLAHTVQPCRRGQLRHTWARGLACWIQIRYQTWLWRPTAMRPATWLLWKTRNVVKKFYWNHTHDCRVNIQYVPVLRLHSAPFSKYLWRRRWCSEWVRFPDTTGTKIAVYSAHSPSELCHTNIYNGPQEERMTVKHTQLFRKSGRWQSYSFVQTKGNLQKIYS
jgi:hypothetical protein